MSDAPIPPYLKAKRTKLPAGHDDSLDPDEPPTDSVVRGIAPIDWPAMDLSRGGNGPPEAPLGPPRVDSVKRTLPASAWPRELAGAVANRSLRETVGPDPSLDPDIAMWPAVQVSLWPFTGPPTEGIWPIGWFGIDDTGTPYVCIEAGEPGTWEEVGAGSGLWGQSSRAKYSGSGTPVGTVTPDAEGDLYVDTTTPALWQSTGTVDTAWEQIGAVSSLVPVAGALASPYSVTTSQATFLTTAALGIGKWVVTFSGLVVPGPGDSVDITTVVATGAATLSGPYSAELTSPGGVAQAASSTFSFLANVTVGGTLAFQAKANAGGTGSILSSTFSQSFPNATGYVATPYVP